MIVIEIYLIFIIKESGVCKTLVLLVLQIKFYPYIKYSLPTCIWVIKSQCSFKTLTSIITIKKEYKHPFD